MRFPERFLYGAAAYRPTNPPREEFRKHLTQIKHELQFDILRFQVQWNPIHSSPGKFDFQELDELMDLCDELGLLVFLEVSLQSAPYWLEEKAPETRYVNALGQPAELGPNESVQIGGYPGLCFHHRPVLEAGERFLREVARHFARRESLLAYDCWNEPHLEPAWISTWGNQGESMYCYCQESRDAFRRWLRTRYGDIETLNGTWGRAYRSWKDVNPPGRRGNYADWLDWGRFWFDDLRDHMRWRYAVLREADADHLIMSHSGAVPPFVPRANAFIHNWKLAEPVDLWGTSFAPLYFNWDIADCAGVIDATRSAARGRPFWMNEISGGACYRGGFRRGPLPTTEDFKVWNWLSVCCGSKASVHWCYLEERTGPESGGFGLVRAGGQITGRARGAAETAGTLRRYSSLFFDYLPQPQVGILYDPDNSMLMFAMEGEDLLVGQSHIGFYRAVWRSDNYARFVTFDSLEDLSGLKVLILPMCMILPEHAVDAIAEFVRDGGVLISEARTGQYDERGFNRSSVPAGRLSEVTGTLEEEPLGSDPDNRPEFNNPANKPWPDPIYGGPTIKFSEPVGAQVRAREYFVPLSPTTGTPIGQCMDCCAAVRNTYGKGASYYFGTYMGLALNKRQPEAQLLLRTILRRHVSPIVTGNTLRPRLIKHAKEALLVVFNENHNEPIEERIAVDQAYEKATDIYSRQEVRMDQGDCVVQVEPDSVLVLRLTD